MTTQCPNVCDCKPHHSCDGCCATWTEFPTYPWKTNYPVTIKTLEDQEKIQKDTSSFTIVEMTDEELDQIQLDAFLEEVGKLWQQKENEDLAYMGEY